MAVEEKNKINEIVEILKKDGVEAGNEEKDKIISDAERKAKDIIKKANEEKEKIIKHAQKESEKIKSSAEANIRMAISQGINQFKESIENSLLQPTIMESLKKNINAPTVKEILLKVIDAYAKAGFDTSDLDIILGKDEQEEVKKTILKEIAGKIENAKEISISDDKIPQGIKLIQKEGNLTLDFTPESIKEVLLSFIRPRFREIFFEGKDD